MFLQEGWVIANHILVSFHVAFISSVLSLPSASIIKGDVLRFIFTSPETLVSALYMYISFHTAISIHELGHFIKAARLNALNDQSQQEASLILRSSFLRRILHLARLFILAPYGKASGIKREGLNYYPDAPYNLAVAAAGPRTSRNVSLLALAPAVIMLTLGITFDILWLIYPGRLFLGIGIVCLLDFLLADPGKYSEFKKRERRAQEKAAAVKKTTGWWEVVGEAKQKMLKGRMQQFIHPRLGPVSAPWQYRNCGMGGRHTEKEYPESNISMQEAMFLILGALDYQEAQEMTVRLQNRLKEIIENQEGCRVMGIGLEGGLAPYIERGKYPMPEVRLWAMMKQTIEECGYQPGVDVAIALDPAMSELETAYRNHFKVPDSIGMYLFWRDKTQTVMDRDGILDLYVTAVKEYDIPILSIEDGFSENDNEGWQKLLAAMGDRVFVIGDDLVTTNDQTIEMAAANSLINSVLVKANQIGTLYETLLAILVSLGKGFDLVVSHRSKSPNDDMEAQIALAVNSLGLKAGGGANTERLIKYHAITELMQKDMENPVEQSKIEGMRPVIRKIYSYEEPTNAGIPSVGSTVEFELAEQGVHLKFKGATPLGTSAGAGEAIHLVDSAIEYSENREVIERFSTYFKETEQGVFAFPKQVKEKQIRASGDHDLMRLYDRSQRYDGKGCLNAVHNVMTVIAPLFINKIVTDFTLKDIDRLLLSEELRVAQRRNKLPESASAEDCVHVMQRKQNLGMNAILSVSLAMARGVAHLQGKNLFEILREEMFAIIANLAKSHNIKIQGSRFTDYVDALREVNGILADTGKSLYEELRNLTGIYNEVSADSGNGKRFDAVEIDRPDHQTKNKSGNNQIDLTNKPEAEKKASSKQPEDLTYAEPTSTLPDITSPEITGAEQSNISALNDSFFEVFRNETPKNKLYEILSQYMSVKHSFMKRGIQFDLVNNCIYVNSEAMLVPYWLDSVLLVYKVPDSSSGVPEKYVLPNGIIITDEFLAELTEFEGKPIDLEGELFSLNPSRCGSVRVSHIRDMAEQIQKISRSVNRADANYLLHNLVAKLSLFSFKKFFTAKNLKSEIHDLLTQLMHFLNSPISYDLPFLVRILVRNITGIVSKPKLIDRLWNDTIELAEVHLRGSSIVNEIRRSTHHALSKQTLLLVKSYLEYLNTGKTDGLVKHGFHQPAPADQEARDKTMPKKIVARIMADLEELLGNADVLSRVNDWQKIYESVLIRCESGESMLDELEKIVSAGSKDRNRWTYYHHLRIINNRVSRFPLLPDIQRTQNRIQELLSLQPDNSAFDAHSTESELRSTVAEFIQTLRSEYQENLFQKINNLITGFNQKVYFKTFTEICELRKILRTALSEYAFPEQRLLLYELDYLLEEMGFVALRHIASQYEDEGVNLPECLEIIGKCALNLSHDGLYSRQLLDLVGILKEESHSYAEITNVLQQIQRNYQHILRQLTLPFERMQAKIELDQEDLRISLANMQRFLHDLNSIASFADMAIAYIKHHISEIDEKLSVRTEQKPVIGEWEKIVHLSHHDEIQRLVNEAENMPSIRGLYGGKGSGLIYISHLNIPTPDGFIIPASIARRHSGAGYGDWLDDIVRNELSTLETDIGKSNGSGRKFGNPVKPLLLAVRGGSVFSMPGILTTVLFTGMNDEIAEALVKTDAWHAYDSYRRFLASFSQAVWGVDVEKYNLVEQAKSRNGVKYKYALSWKVMRGIVEETKDVIRNEGFGKELDDVLNDPIKQLSYAVRAVLNSWDNAIASRYRELKGICDSWQTAVIIQEMVSGNRQNEDVRTDMDETRASLTGVIPKTDVNELGIHECTGEFKFSACGEDLVGGLTTSISFMPITKLKSYMPMLDRRLEHVVMKLARFMGTDQEIEFTVDRGILSVLQSRAAEIGANRHSYNFIDTNGSITRGLGIRGTAFRGLVAFNEQDFKELKSKGLTDRDDNDGILMLLENPSPMDIPLLLEAEGLLTAKGGSTSHAAVAINGIEHKDYTAVMSADRFLIDEDKHEAVIIDDNGNVIETIHTGDILSIHGATGMVYVGARPIEHMTNCCNSKSS